MSNKKLTPYHAAAHRDTLIATLSAYDNSDLPDGAWQAMLEDGAKAFTKAYGISIEPFDAFMEYVEHSGDKA